MLIIYVFLREMLTRDDNSCPVKQSSSSAWDPVSASSLTDLLRTRSYRMSPKARHCFRVYKNKYEDDECIAR